MSTTHFKKQFMYTTAGKTFLVFTIVLILLAGVAPQVAQATGETPAQTFFLSMPEDQVRTAFVAIDTGNGSMSSTMVSITSIAVTVDGTIIYYDQWEDGYEALSTTPVQSSTLVFGDGNTANGNACAYAATLCSSDVLTAGAVVVLRNDVPSNPRGTHTYFDAKDKVAVTQVVAVTRAMWDSSVGTVLAGALQVYDTNGYGTEFRLPVGENFPETATSETSTIVLRPTSDVSVGNWAEFSPGADADTYRFNEIDEATADDSTTAISGSGTNEYQAGTTNPSVPADATNISVNIVWRAREASNSSNQNYSKLRVNGTYYQFGDSHNLSTSYSTYTDTWDTNPAGGAWTPATVNTVNGLGFDTSNGSTPKYVTQAYIEISYDTPSAFYDNQMFDYDSVFIMAANDDTVVSIDSDGNGTTDYTANLDSGEAYMLNGAATGVTINSNAHITSNLPIQVNMITGDIDSQNKYENRWFNIPPLALWGSSYVTPVGSPNTSSPSDVFIYNPNASAITVNYMTSGGGTGGFTVNAGETYRYEMPVDSGARFSSSAGSFLAIGTADSANVTGDDGRSWDWGYTLIAEEQLAPMLAVGWAPGSNAVPPTNNGSPVWVSAAAATTIYVDYDGNPATGANIDINGSHYDTTYTVAALQSIRIFDPDNDQTGMRVYTVDGTLLAAAWGEDPATAGAGNPYLDMGYVVFPLPQMTVTKDGVLDVSATAPIDAANVGDVINYTLTVTNKGNRTLTNTTLVDAKLGTLSCTPAQPSTLVMGASLVCTGSYTLTAADIAAGVVYNTAIGDSNQTPPISVQGEVKIPKLVVSKAANPTAVPETGGSVTFTFQVKNDNSIASGVSLTIKGLTDSVYGALAGDSDCQVGTVLAPQGTCSFSITRMVAGDFESGLSHSNRFTTIAQDSSGTNVSAKSDAMVTFTDIDPAINVEKYVSVDGGVTWLDADTAPGPNGGSVTNPQFKFVVTNTGPVALSNVDVTDNVYGNIHLDGTLAAGASVEYTLTGIWAEGQHSNTATATGDMTDGASNTESATDSDSANYFGAKPALSLTKNASPSTYSAVGQMIAYTYVVTNTGNVPAAGPVTVSDDKATVTCPSGGLAPGAFMTCTASYNITQSDLDSGSVKNTAQAHANGVDSNSADATVTATPSPALSLTKSPSPSTYDTVGEIITYSYTIKNTGNVTLSGPFLVTDDKITVTSCQQPADGKLSPDEEMSCTASYAVTQANLDASKITNTATASNGAVNSNEATATVNAIAKPNLSLKKTANPATYDSVGDVINYSYEVKNIGNVALSAPYTLADDKATDEFCPQTPDPLPVGSSITCTASYAVTQVDLDEGKVTNKATAAAVFGGNPVTSNEAQATVSAEQNPALAIDKSATESSYDAVNDVIHYSYLVTNAGNVTLHDAITVNDNKAVVTCPALPAGGLAPDASINCSASYTILQSDLDAGSLTNVASATDGTVTSPSDTVTVPAVQTKALALDKDASPATYSAAGETINYTYDLTNTGNVTLSGPFTVDDDQAAVTCEETVTSLAPGETVTCTASHIVSQVEMDSGSITNHATAHAFFGSTPVDSNPDSETVTAKQLPALTIVKTADPTTYDAVGDLIGYSYLVTNSGNVTLYNISVVDDKATVTCPDTSGGLTPSATITCTASYTITQEDLDGSSVTNSAYATDGTTSSQPDSETVNAIQMGGLGLSKSAAPLIYDAVGDTITYTYVVENTGNVTLAGPFTVNDNKVGAVSCPTGSLAPTKMVTCTADYSITQSDLDSGFVTNIATATDGNLISNEATATVAAEQKPALSIEKTALEPSYYYAGDLIHYEYVVTNIGNVTLHNPIVVSDDKAADEACEPLPVGGLAPNASITCTASYAIMQSDMDAGSLTNVASAASGTTVSPTDTVTIPAEQNLLLTLKKSANPLFYTTVGQEITYDYQLWNDGNVTLSGPFEVSDDKATVTCPAEVTSLAPGDLLNCTATYTITQADLDSGSVINIATATAHFNGETVTSNEDAATVTADQNPVLTLDKTASPATYDQVGQVINYSYLLTNDGNVTLGGPFTVYDSITGNATCPAAPAQLAPGDSITCASNYAITQADLDFGAITNEALAKGYFYKIPILSNWDMETVTAVATPDLSLVKSASPTTYDHAGQSIAYSYVLKNIGNVTLTAPYTVDDDKATVTCPEDPILEVNGSITCTAIYIITQADMDAGAVTNLATGHSQTQLGTPVNSNEASTTVNADQKPALTIEKTASPLTYNHAGQVISYSYKVANIGNITLYDPITVSDDKATDETCPALPVGGLAPGVSITCSATYTVTQADLDSGSVTNIASATSGSTISPTDTETVTATQNPKLTLTKAGIPNFSDPVKVGDTIAYTLVATNDGNVTLTGVTISDAKLGTLVCTQPVALAPGASLTCTGSYGITQADIDTGKVHNTGTADSDQTQPVHAPVDVNVPQSPVLSLSKSGALDMTVVAPSDWANAGDKINYTLTATNAGNVTLTNVTVVDQKLGTLSCIPEQPASLAPGETILCTGSFILTQADINAGMVDNTATANSTQTEPVQAPQSVIIPQVPHIKLTKVADPKEYDHTGQVIGYSMVATNDGNVTLTGVEITDTRLIGLNCSPSQPAILAPGASLTCTGSYTIKQADMDAGKVSNTAGVSGQPPVGDPVGDAATETVNAKPEPALTIVKTATPAMYDSVGDVIGYSYLVTNTGNVTLYNISVVDDKANVTCPSTADGLAPQAEITCTASYTITQADLDAGSVTNTAYATDGTTSSPSDSETVTADKKPALAIVKTATPATYDAVGDVIGYSYLVTNTGNVTLYGISVVDNKISSVSCPGSSSGLAPEAQITCTGSYTITQADLNAGSVTNIAYATDGTTKSPNDSETVAAEQKPELSLTKRAAEASFNQVGQVLHYTLVAKNTGNVILMGVKITDVKLGTLDCTPLTQPVDLNPGESLTCRGTYTASQTDLDAGEFKNTASATGTPPNHDLITITAEAIVPAVKEPALQLFKSATTHFSTPAKVGDTITYNLTAKNIGNVTLTNVSINDAKLGTLSCTQPVHLTPGAMLFCTKEYILTQDDINAGKVSNTAFADSDETEPVQASVDVNVPQAPHLSLAKSATKRFSTPPKVGDIIQYSLVATNDGNVTLNQVSISDALLGTLVCTPEQPATLAPEATLSCTGSYAISQADIDAGRVSNTGIADSEQTPPVEKSIDTPIPQSPGLALDKSATLRFSDPVKVGDTIDYSLVAANTGNTTLTNVTITDAKLGPLTCTPSQPAILLVGETLACTGSYTLTQADINAGKVMNTGIADSNQTPPVETPNTVTVPVYPHLSLVKSGVLDMTIVAPSGRADVGDKINYTLTTTNDGNVTLTDVKIADTLIDTTLSCTPAQPATLAPGAILTCTGTHVITQVNLDAGKVSNTATVTGKYGDTTLTDTKSVDVPLPQLPELKLVKEATPATYDTLGQTISYKYTLTNNSNVTLSGPFTVADDKATDEACPAVATMAPGSTIICMASYAITQADLDSGSVTNKATASGLFGNTPVTSNEAQATVTAMQNAALALVKTADPITYTTVGQTITYTYVAKNSGNITLSGPFDISDTILGSFQCSTATTLAPGASITCTKTYTITQADLDAGYVTNKATATNGTITSNEATATVNAVQSKSLLLTKTATPTTYVLPGEVITYTFVLKNTGNVSLSAPYAVADNKTSDETCPSTPASLAPGDSITCMAHYTIVAADLTNRSVTNTATASAMFGTQKITSNEATATVTMIEKPAVMIEKSPDLQKLPAKSPWVASWNIKVTNIGNVPLNTILVSDAKVPACNKTFLPTLTLQPGQSTTSYSCSYTFPTNFEVTYPHTTPYDWVNTAAVTAKTQSGTVVKASDEAAVDFLPRISVEKFFNPKEGVLFTGGTVGYVVMVYNNSIEPVTITSLYDDKFGELLGGPGVQYSTVCRDNLGNPYPLPITLQSKYKQPGYVFNCYFKKNISGDAGTYHTNTVVATAADNEGNITMNQATAKVFFYWYGLTSGYWKQSQHFSDWPSPYTKDQTVRSIFTVPSYLLTNGKLDLDGNGIEDTLLHALNYKGGSTVKGKAQNFLRAAVAALLNEAKFGIYYPAYNSTSDLIKAINKTLGMNNGALMTSMGSQLDKWNNGHE